PHQSGHENILAIPVCAAPAERKRLPSSGLRSASRRWFCAAWCHPQAGGGVGSDPARGFSGPINYPKTASQTIYAVINLAGEVHQISFPPILAGDPELSAVDC